MRERACRPLLALSLTPAPYLSDLEMQYVLTPLQAQKWLGVSSLEEALAADPPEDPTLSQPRPPGLGLGADPRKHGKVKRPYYCEWT